MSWSADTMDALRTWLGPGTAHKNHPIDNSRFFLFVGHVWHDCRGLWDEEYALEIIKREAKELHPDWGDALLDQIAERRRSEGTGILDFLCALRDAGKLNELLLS